MGVRVHGIHFGSPPSAVLTNMPFATCLSGAISPNRSAIPLLSITLCALVSMMAVFTCFPSTAIAPAPTTLRDFSLLPFPLIALLGIMPLLPTNLTPSCIWTFSLPVPWLPTAITVFAVLAEVPHLPAPVTRAGVRSHLRSRVCPPPLRRYHGCRPGWPAAPLCRPRQNLAGTSTRGALAAPLRPSPHDSLAPLDRLLSAPLALALCMPSLASRAHSAPYTKLPPSCRLHSASRRLSLGPPHSFARAHCCVGGSCILRSFPLLVSRCRRLSGDGDEVPPLLLHCWQHSGECPSPSSFSPLWRRSSGERDPLRFPLSPCLGRSGARTTLPRSHCCRPPSLTPVRLGRAWLILPSAPVRLLPLWRTHAAAAPSSLLFSHVIRSEVPPVPISAILTPFWRARPLRLSFATMSLHPCIAPTLVLGHSLLPKRALGALLVPAAGVSPVGFLRLARANVLVRLSGFGQIDSRCLVLAAISLISALDLQPRVLLVRFRALLLVHFLCYTLLRALHAITAAHVSSSSPGNFLEALSTATVVTAPSSPLRRAEPSFIAAGFSFTADPARSFSQPRVSIDASNMARIACSLAR
ncbi:unnamed protein product [Closterium sp. NIES-53]